VGGPITSIEQLDNVTHLQVGHQLIFRMLEDEDPAPVLVTDDSESLPPSSAQAIRSARSKNSNFARFGIQVW
jgi:hypothetical protein